LREICGDRHEGGHLSDEQRGFPIALRFGSVSARGDFGAALADSHQHYSRPRRARGGRSAGRVFELCDQEVIRERDFADSSRMSCAMSMSKRIVPA